MYPTDLNNTRIPPKGGLVWKLGMGVAHTKNVVHANKPTNSVPLSSAPLLRRRLVICDTYACRSSIFPNARWEIICKARSRFALISFIRLRILASFSTWAWATFCSCLDKAGTVAFFLLASDFRTSASHLARSASFPLACTLLFLLERTDRRNK